MLCPINQNTTQIFIIAVPFGYKNMIIHKQVRTL